MRGRVVAVDPTAEHGDGDTTGLERAAMRLAVDAAREAADDDEPGRGELAAEAARDLRAVRRARAGADDCNGRLREHVHRPRRRERRAARRVVDRAKKGRADARVRARERRLTDRAPAASGTRAPPRRARPQPRRLRRARRSCARRGRRARGRARTAAAGRPLATATRPPPASAVQALATAPR